MMACVEEALAQDCRVLLLPAGFFVVSSFDEQSALERAILARLKGNNLLIAFGIDLIGGDKSAGGKAARETGEQTYTLFGYVVEHGRYLIRRTAQTGIRSREVREVAPAVRAERSAVSQLLGDATIGLLLCGEVLSPSWHDALQQIQPQLVLHLAHASVILGGTSKESWAPHIGRLMAKLPSDGLWAFADHMRRMGHSDAENEMVPLVRRNSQQPVPVLARKRVEHAIPATIYVHAAA